MFGPFENPDWFNIPPQKPKHDYEANAEANRRFLAEQRAKEIAYWKNMQARAAPKKK